MMNKQEVVTDPQYLTYVGQYPFWSNTLTNAMPQTECAKQALNFLEGPSDGRRKKVAVLGYDGARADLLVNLLKSHEEEQTADFSSYVSGHEPMSQCSGIRTLVNNGGYLYLTYAGGQKGTKTEQPTETAAGWSSISSGVWRDQHQVVDNTDVKSPMTSSFMLQAAKDLKLSASFIASWAGYFDNVFVNEMATVQADPSISMNYIQCANDLDTYRHVSDAIARNQDIVFCTFEATDWNGHATGFSNRNYRYVNGFRDEDELAYCLIQEIRNRPTYEAEDWLIMLTTDHGGLGINHGGQSFEERTTWLASNKPF